MNIHRLKSIYDKARQLRADGKTLAAAREYLVAQRMAKLCRSAARHDLFAWAHAGATLSAGAILKNSTAHAERSEAGRIIAESGHLFRRGL